MTTSTVKPSERHVVRALLPLNYKNCQDTESVDRNLAAVADFIVEKWVDSKEDVCTGITACVTEFTNNTHLYALLICHLHQKYREISTPLVHHFNVSLSRTITDGDWRGIKAILRLLAELVGLDVLVRQDVVATFAFVTSVLSDGMASQERKDAFIACFLKAMLTAGSILGEEASMISQYESISEYVMNGRGERRLASHACRMFVRGIDFEQPDPLDLLWQQFNNCRQNGWTNALLVRHVSTMISYDAVEASTKLLHFPVAQLSLYSPYAEYPLVTTQYQIFHSSIISAKGRAEINLPPIDSVERVYLYDIIQDTVDIFQSNIHELLKYVEECLCFADSVNLFQVIMDVLVSSIMRLPEAAAKSIFYQTVIMELCRKYPKNIPPILGKTFYTLFDNIDRMDVELLFRFSSWFAIHISNFDFKWNWKEWKPVLDQDESRQRPQTRFVMEALEKCVRMSFYERVTKSFPEGVDLSPWMPPQPQPDFTFIAEKGCAIGEVELANRLMDAMRQSVIDPRLVVNDIHGYYSAIVSNADECKRMVLKMVASCIFQLGTKSFSHMLGAIEKHGDLIKNMCESDENQLSVIDICFGFWRDNMQFFMITVDKLVKSQVVNEITLVVWLFGGENFKYDCWRSYRWDMLNSIVQAVSSAISALQLQIERPATTTQISAEEIESKLESLKKRQKTLLIKIFQEFIVSVTNAGSDDVVQSMLLETMRMFGRRFHKEVKALSNTLEMLVFASQPENIKTIFTQLKSIHA